METLSRRLLDSRERELHDSLLREAVTVLQVGEGNFLRGFTDWMLHECRKQGLFNGGVAVTQPRPAGREKIEALAAQDGLYTLVTRGLERGEPVERREIVSVFTEAFDAYSEWERFVELAERPELRFVVSNTTEAGLAYAPEKVAEGEPIASFPGKAAYLLYRRFLRFGGEPGRGLIWLPCELLERNGDELKRCIMRHSRDWGLPEAFERWVETENRFLNSLVDRIVTGYPEGRAEEWFDDWGYRDRLLNTAEPYHFWAIEAEPELERELPLQQAGLNVVWTNDLKPYQLRKVRILNGAHALMTPIGILHGFEHVGELMADTEFGVFVTGAVEQDIIPTLPLGREALQVYAADVFDRFRNPYLRHRLADIAMNGLSKFKVRLLPAIAHYAEQGSPVPERLVRGVAGMLRYYRTERSADGSFEGVTLTGRTYAVRDDGAAVDALAQAWRTATREACSGSETAGRLLALTGVWGRDLTAWPGFAEAVGSVLAEWETREAAGR